MRFHLVLGAAAALQLMASTAQAGVVTSAASVLNAPPTIGLFTFARTIDQSGLSTGYVSGVTDFATYISGAPQHIGSNSPANYAASNNLPPSATVDYDMGSALGLLQLAFWNYPFATIGPILSFNVFTSNDAAFSSSLLVGSFTAIDDGTTIGPPGNAVQVFDLLDSTARYVRMQVLTTASAAGFGWSEVAFDVGRAHVPTPPTWALVGVAALGLAWSRRKPV